jgi:hypothetical protein
MTAMSDAEQIHAIIKAIYAAISGPAGERDWKAHSRHFAAGARSFVLHRTPDGDKLVSYDQDEYQDSRAPFFRAHSFWEVETKCDLEIAGPLATASSYYDSFWDLKDPPFESGLNNILFVRLNAEWKIASIMWEARSAAKLVAEASTKQ